MKLDETQKNWEKFAQEDPLWSILTEKDKYGNRWNKDDFFVTGKMTINGVLDQLGSYGIELAYGKALDFGCGVGRLTQALGDSFVEANGVDISPTMIKLAKEFNTKPNVSFFYNNAEDLSLFQDNDFDFIYTLITLQHIEPRYVKRYIQEFLRILKPQGICMFQMPSHVKKTASSRIFFWIERHIPSWAMPIIRMVYFRRRKIINAVMEIHCIPQKEMEAFVESNGAKICRVVDDESVGPHVVSRVYIVKK